MPLLPGKTNQICSHNEAEKAESNDKNEPRFDATKHNKPVI